MNLVKAGALLVLVICLNALKSDCEVIENSACTVCNDPESEDNEIQCCTDGCQCTPNVNPTENVLCLCYNRAKREDSTIADTATTAATTAASDTKAPTVGDKPTDPEVGKKPGKGKIPIFSDFFSIWPFNLFQ